MCKYIHLSHHGELLKILPNLNDQNQYIINIKWGFKIMKKTKPLSPLNVLKPRLRSTFNRQSNTMAMTCKKRYYFFQHVFFSSVFYFLFQLSRENMLNACGCWNTVYLLWLSQGFSTPWQRGALKRLWQHKASAYTCAVNLYKMSIVYIF